MEVILPGPAQPRKALCRKTGKAPVEMTGGVWAAPAAALSECSAGRSTDLRLCGGHRPLALPRTQTACRAGREAMTIREFEERWRGHAPRPQGVRKKYAVLVPLVERAGEACLLFEVRAETLGRQPGEVCFPGGHMEPEEEPAGCALRETEEELGIPRSAVQLIAPLDYQTGQGSFVLYPLLGRVDPAAVDAMRPSPAEVKETFLVPVDFFRDHPPRVYSYELVPQVGDDFPYALVGAQKRYGWHRGRMDVPIYLWQGRAIWGMTGRIVRRNAKARR